jgi:hypothetical protein
MREPLTGRTRKVHPYEWLWEPLETDPTFLLRPMFGGKAAYLDGKLVLYFSANEEPWRGMLVCTERSHHPSLLAEFSALARHPILSKWLYLSEGADSFERTAERLVALARRRDPRLGVNPGKARRKPRSDLDAPRQPEAEAGASPNVR